MRFPCPSLVPCVTCAGCRVPCGRPDRCGWPQYPDIGTVEVREAPDIPLTFGSPAHDTVMLELQDAGQMGHGALQQSKLTEVQGESRKFL